MRQNGERRPEDILAEIERTRTDMDATLSAIEHRLTPGQLVDQGLDYLRKSGGNEFVKNLGGQARHNPMPVALVGIGLAWLMASGRSAPAQSWGSESAPGGLRERASGAKEKLSQTSQSISESARAARDRLYQARDTAGRQYQRARRGYDSMLREQPLALGAIGLAIGAVLAAAAPRTRKEDELMGPARERLAEKAREAGKEQLEKARQAIPSQQAEPATPFPTGG